MTEPDYNVDSPNYAFKGPQRLAEISDRLNKQFQDLGINAMCFGFMAGVYFCDAKAEIGLVACVVAWIAIVLPRALGSTAELWSKHLGAKLLIERHELLSAQMTPEEATEHRRKVQEYIEKQMRS